MKLTDIAGSFEGNIWKREVNVRDFIQYNYTPYEGDDSFLAPATENTLALWDKLSEMFKVEREKGLYDVETRLPQSVTTYGEGEFLRRRNSSSPKRNHLWCWLHRQG